ncbi:sulfotransferase [Thiolapillus sp.]|uniref:sulfotransferase n=1 Tax=Thiolapillus sp. TaxID=2017437 RepID=UPI0025CF89C2
MNLKKWLRKKRRQLKLAQLTKQGKACSPKKWVFIVGCYNSGTTLLHDVIASHPEVAHLPREGQYCTDQLLIPSDVGLTRVWALQPEMFVPSLKNEPDAEKIKRQWCGYMSNPLLPVFLEKSIPNAARVEWLNRHFPDAHFIALIRNGYAVAEGIHRKAGQSVEVAAKQWQQSNRIMLDQLDKVERKLLLRYEDLTSKPAESLEKVMKFLGLDIARLQADKHWTVHGETSKIRNMNARSISRLSDEDKAFIRGEAQEMLDAFHYSSDK